MSALGRAFIHKAELPTHIYARNIYHFYCNIKVVKALKKLFISNIITCLIIYIMLSIIRLQQ